MIKLIASDLDGTLLQNGAQELDPLRFDQIRELKEMGIHFVAASGRQYPNLQRLFAPVQDEISYIAENGSLCIHDGKTLSKGLIPRELGNRIIDAIHSCSGCECIVSGEQVCYSDSVNEVFRDSHAPCDEEQHAICGQHGRGPGALSENRCLQF